MRSAAEPTKGSIPSIKLMAEEMLHLATGEALCLRSHRIVHRFPRGLLQLVYAVRMKQGEVVSARRSSMIRSYLIGWLLT